MSLLFTESLYVRHVSVEAGEVKMEDFKSLPRRQKGGESQGGDGRQSGKSGKSRLPIRRGGSQPVRRSREGQTQGVVEARWSSCKTLPLPQKYLVHSPVRRPTAEHVRWSLSSDWGDGEPLKPIAMATGMTLVKVESGVLFRL